ncbi:MAG: DUF523 and DUF1722 domain-containing protein [Candidatus Poseidoniaceae archaeon]|nr:DUF523 and DUF1722 domain-containing protein [Candidatus Poseidoniaceae archaeon]
MPTRPKLGVSACLLGQKVRHNGEHAEARNLTESWSRHLDLVGVCPEVGIGMTTPRATTRLVKRDGRIHLLDSNNNTDLSQDMIDYAELQSDALTKAGICGFVFKSGSASCGLERIKVTEEGQIEASNDGTGLFALVFTTLNPHIPVIEEVSLSDPLQAEHFLARVEFFSLWLEEARGGWTANKIAQFHDSNKLFFISRSPNAKRNLGRLIAQAFDRGDHPENVAFEYMAAAQKSLNVLTKPGPIAHAMERVLGRISPSLSGDERQELLGVINEYRRGLQPRSAPLTLLRTHVRNCGMDNETHARFITPTPLRLDLLANV